MGDREHLARRVLLVSGAGSIHTLRWANALAGTGLEVHLATEHSPIDVLDGRVTLHRWPHGRGLGYFLNGPRLAALVRRLRPDVVNTHYASGYGTLARWVRGVPHVLNVWGSDVYEFPDRSPLHAAWLRGNLRHAQIVVSTSHAMAARTRQVCSGLAAIPVVPFGVDTSRFRPPAQSRPDRDGVVIGTVKVLDVKYGIDVLLKAFRLLVDKLAAQGPAAPGPALRIVGGGPQREALERLAESLGIADRTRFVGPVPHADVPAELAAMDVYCALSRFDSESFGVAVLEASACGLPVVVSDAGGLPEVVMDGTTGLVVPRERPDAAAEALAALTLDPARRSAMGAAGVRHVAGHYTWSASVHQLLDVYDEAIRTGRPARRGA